jgi:hypothetical protein
VSKWLAVVCLLLLCLVGAAHAQQAVSGRSQGMGNSNFSALGGSEAIFQNPAALPWLATSAQSADSKTWGGQALAAANYANANGPAAPDSQHSFMAGGGVTNGRHGLGVYFSDEHLLTGAVQETGIGYGYSFNKEWAVGGMLRILDRPHHDDDVQVTDFSVQRNWWQGNGRAITATAIVRDPYNHTPEGCMLDIGGSAYFSKDFLFTAWVHDVTGVVHRLLNVGAEVEVRPGWFIRTGYDEKPGKALQGISLGVGHRMKDWQFDAALTKYDVRLSGMDLDVGLTGSATVFF